MSEYEAKPNQTKWLVLSMALSFAAVTAMIVAVTTKIDLWLLVFGVLSTASIAVNWRTYYSKKA